MIKAIIIALAGVFLGLFAGFLIIKNQTALPIHIKKQTSKQVIGFLPYWQLQKAKPSELAYLSTLTYFALNVDGNGHIVKLSNEQEEDPGWYGLHSDKLKSILKNARNNNISLSLLISSGDSSAIDQLMTKPTQHAKTLISEIKPIMKAYKFTDLNLDIEYTYHASPSAQKNFTQFVKSVKEQLDHEKLATLTVEISPTDVIKYNLINVSAIAPYANTIVLMAYDYHSPDSLVTGPVAPLNGAGVNSEYDVASAVERTLQSLSADKLILGMPLYGYEWETLNTAVRSAIIPGSGVLASNNRAQEAAAMCASCSAFFDTQAQEAFIVYRDTKSNTYHQFSYPNNLSVSAKISYADKKQLGGIALWALGYESDSMLDPLADYKQN